MKSKCTELAIRVGVILTNFIYLFFKLLPTQNKVSFISRLDDNTPLDFSLIINALRKRRSSIKIEVLTKPLDYGLVAKIVYAPHILRQMYHIATSKVVVIDSYCIPICILRHKKSLRVIQLWHGLGSFKKFAHSILGKRESITNHVSLNAKKLAKLMHMHENYNLMIASNKTSAKHFAEAFNYSPDKVEVISLPRVDFLTDAAKVKSIRKRIISAHPELKAKKNILYAPTFRRSEHDFRQIQKMIDNMNYDEYNLIVKLHLLTENKIQDSRITNVEDFTAMELLTISDYLVTDYSAIIYEGYLLGVPAFFYQFDQKKYEDGRGFYTPLAEFPAECYTNATDLMKDIERNKYNKKGIKPFIDKQITYKSGNADKLADIVIEYAEGER